MRQNRRPGCVWWLAVVLMFCPWTSLWAQEWSALGNLPGGKETQPRSTETARTDSAEKTCLLGLDWKKVPPVTPVARPGAFLIPPTGPGYYSFHDWITHEYREKPPLLPFGRISLFPDSTFNWDFRYLEKADNQQHDWSDCYKRIHCGEHWLLSLGGEARYRFANEVNSRLTGRSNSYDLTRLRVFGDLWYDDRFRLFVEYHDARFFNGELARLAVDDTGSDLLNAFVEIRLGDIDCQPVYVRAGRQELLYGSQRLISPPDWVNTRRTFDGVTAYWHTEKYNLDVFWARPVIPEPNDFDNADHNRDFFGVWNTWKPKAGTTVDLYWLYLNQRTPGAAGYIHTIGGRVVGDVDGELLYDFEGMLQFGEQRGKTVVAQAWAAGLGWRWKECCWNPQVWVYYDFGSGSGNPQGAVDHTFNQLFPFGHYYLGFLDLVGRQNIHDVNFQASVNPEPWITLLGQCHVFHLASSQDALYSAAGVPLRRDRTGRSGNYVGTELDFLVNFHLTAHQDLLIGYSVLFAGEFIRNTGPGQDPQLFYTQYSFRW